MPKMLRVVLSIVLSALVLGACGDSEGGGAAAENDNADNESGQELVVYSGRNENLVRPLLDRFKKDTGIDIRVRYGDTNEMLATILEEGDNTRADVFFSQDAGALGEMARRKLLAPLAQAQLDLVPASFRDPGGTWIGVTGRARVVAYNTDKLTEADLPKSVFELTEPKWKGKVGFPPSNASFVAYISALREQHGDQRVEQFLQGLKANEAKKFDNNVLTLEAIAAGEIEVGLVNHYYLYGELKDTPNAPVKNFYPGQQDGGEGTFVNVAGVGILNRTKNRAAADRFVQYLLDTGAQEYFRDETTEYPLRQGVNAIPELPAISSLKLIDVPLSELGKDLQGTVELIRRIGLS
jgi:iron(III) transport system substrate-binding protein